MALVLLYFSRDSRSVEMWLFISDAICFSSNFIAARYDVIPLKNAFTIRCVRTVPGDVMKVSVVLASGQILSINPSGAVIRSN